MANSKAAARQGMRGLSRVWALAATVTESRVCCAGKPHHDHHYWLCCQHSYRVSFAMICTNASIASLRRTPTSCMLLFACSCNCFAVLGFPSFSPICSRFRRTLLCKQATCWGYTSLSLFFPSLRCSPCYVGALTCHTLAWANDCEVQVLVLTLWHCCASIYTEPTKSIASHPSWSQSPVGGVLARDLLRRAMACRDIQTAAMLHCVFTMPSCRYLLASKQQQEEERCVFVECPEHTHM